MTGILVRHANRPKIRKAMDLYVESAFDKGEIDNILHTRYKTARRPFNDADMTGDN
jgi:hypothetical protein